MKDQTPQALATTVRELQGMTLVELRSEWRRRYGWPPQMRSVAMLARLLAWRMQVDALGGLDPAIRKKLQQKSMPSPDAGLEVGMRLEREWRGIRQRVEVVPGGFRWNGQTFKSLSQVAQAITGTKWNGPKFFGLRQAAA